MLLALVLLALCACRADISAYADTPITVVDLTEEPFTITPGELAQLDCVSATARGNSDKAGTVQARGPLLRTLAESRGRQSATTTIPLSHTKRRATARRASSATAAPNAATNMRSSSRNSWNARRTGAAIP